MRYHRIMARYFIFDHHGNAFGLIYDNGDVTDIQGRHICFVHDDSIFDYNGQHRGWYENGIFRDHWGNTVAFLKNATDSPRPLLPLTNLPPLPGLKQLRPLRPLRSLKPLKALKTFNWSPYSLFEIVGL